MPGPGTIFLSGPVQTGVLPNHTDLGLCVLTQNTTLSQAGTATVSATLTIPASSQIIDILADTTTAWNSGSSDTLSVGITASATTYAGSVNVASAGRIRPTYSATQLTNMLTVGTNTSVVVTVTPAGTAATSGTTTVTLIYAQTVQLGSGET